MKKIQIPKLEGFSKRLVEERIKKGITQKELAEKIGISQRMLVHYEKSDRIPLKHLKEICEVLNISSDFLLGLNNNTKKENNFIDIKIAKRVKLIEKLPERDKILVFSFINSLLEKRKSKQPADSKK
jgi:transcriptional regulator with XRE-family HTH domain